MTKIQHFHALLDKVVICIFLQQHKVFRRRLRWIATFFPDRLGLPFEIIKYKTSSRKPSFPTLLVFNPN
jgi:hypothetical protein